MKPTSTFLCRVFLGLLLTGLHLSANAQSAQNLGADLSEKLTELGEKYNLKGLAASVVFSDGSVWSGVQSPTGNLGTDMLFEMGSSTKTYTAAIILQMVNEGALNMTDTLGMFFDQFEHIDMGITIKQLLNHTAGTFSYTEHDDFIDVIFNEPNRVFSPDEVLDLYMKPMRFEPGTNWRYSNTNFFLLGLIIEKVDGIKYEESLRKRIFEPYGLEHSYLDGFENYSEPRSGVWIGEETYQTQPYMSLLTGAWAAGGVVSTTEDLALWAHKLYTNQVLTEAWTDSMKQLTTVKGKERWYGLGMFYRKYEGTELYGHGGTTFQHSTMEYSPEHDFSLVMVINEQTRGAASAPVQDEMLDFLFSRPWGLNTPEKRAFRTSLYPNPAHGQIHVKTQMTSGELVLFDLTGKQVLATSIKEQNTINIGYLEKGTYVAEIRGPKGQPVQRERVLVM